MRREKDRKRLGFDCLALAFAMVLFHVSSPGVLMSQDLESYGNEELLAKASRAFDSRNFLAAEKYFRELSTRLQEQLRALKPTEEPETLEIHEELIIAPFGLGHSLLFLHHYEQARRALEEGLRLYPDWATNHTPLHFFQDPHFTGPLLLDLQGQMSDSSRPAPILLFGYIQFFRENYPEAAKAFSLVLESNPNDFFAGYFAAQIERKFSQKDTQGSAATDEAAVERDPSPLPLEELMNEGSSLFRNADYRRAAKVFKKAIQSGGDYPLFYIAYGDSLFALGRFEEATNAILRGLQDYPKYAEVQINRRDFYGNPSEFDLQMERLEIYVRKHPGNPRARFLLGYNYFFTQEYDKAEQQFQVVLADKSLLPHVRLLHELTQKFQNQKGKRSPG